MVQASQRYALYEAVAASKRSGYIPGVIIPSFSNYDEKRNFNRNISVTNNGTQHVFAFN